MSGLLRAHLALAAVTMPAQEDRWLGLMRSWAHLLFAVSLAGCAAADDARYQIGSGKELFTRPDASQAFAQAVSVGSRQGLDGPLKVVFSPMPVYPLERRRAGIVGKVKVIFTVGASGRVSDPSLVGSPAPQLAALVLETILQWRFEPPRRGGEAVPVRASQIFAFVTK